MRAPRWNTRRCQRLRMRRSAFDEIFDVGLVEEPVRHRAGRECQPARRAMRQRILQFTQFRQDMLLRRTSRKDRSPLMRRMSDGEKINLFATLWAARTRRRPTRLCVA
jgi:hypothetical protein